MKSVFRIRSLCQLLVSLDRGPVIFRIPLDGPLLILSLVQGPTWYTVLRDNVVMMELDVVVGGYIVTIKSTIVLT